MIPLNAPCFPAGCRKRFLAILKTHDLTGSRYIRKFESAFAALYGMPHAVAVNSGTSALLMTLAGLGVERGGGVIVPAYTCKAVLDVLKLWGASPIFVDSYADYKHMDFNPSEESILEALRKHGDTKAVILPYAFGKVHTYSNLGSITQPIIEDVTLSLGARGIARLSVESSGSRVTHSTTPFCV
jgi:perosamine synthetase